VPSKHLPREGFDLVTAPSILFPTYIEPYAEPRWWTRDATSPMPIGPVPPGLHKRCETHVKYTLSCRQFDRLLARSGGYCEACGLPASTSRFGTLCIDHDHNLGDWAVRGLLCTACNAALHPGAVSLPKFRPYVQRSFYLTLLVEAGVTELRPPEPPLGAVVLDHGGRPWRHEPDYLPGLRWYPRHRHYPQSPRSWDWLLNRVGPLHLRLYVAAAAA
jgi:hypothetical protein